MEPWQFWCAAMHVTSVLGGRDRRSARSTRRKVEFAAPVPDGKHVSHLLWLSRRILYAERSNDCFNRLFPSGAGWDLSRRACPPAAAMIVGCTRVSFQALQLSFEGLLLRSQLLALSGCVPLEQMRFYSL